jgi:hypothetical protein
MTELTFYRYRVIYHIPGLRSLDGEEVLAEEKIKSENFHGLDFEDRQAIFKDLFPYGTFFDRRIHHIGECEDESDSDNDADNI